MSSSIVIPTFNRAPFVVEAARSALEAGVAAEIIVVDGGSSDDTVEQLHALGDDVTLITGDYPNAAATRNAGARAASTEFLGFLDSDDLMLGDKVTCLERILRADESIALAHGRISVIDEAGAPLADATTEHLQLIDVGERQGTSYSALAAVCGMFTSATLLRRSAFDAVGGYDETLEVYEDWDLYLRLAVHHRLVYAPCTTARYRVWTGNVAWQRTAEWTARVAEKHLASLPELTKDERASARFGFLARLSMSNHVLVRTRDSRRFAFAAFRLDPVRAYRNPSVRRTFIRSFVPKTILRRRRP